jgi:hypothetical protein
LYFSLEANNPSRASLPTAVTRPEDIPCEYGADQVLLDAGGRLAAWTCNGETDYVVTYDGSVHGSDFTLLTDWFRKH